MTDIELMPKAAQDAASGVYRIGERVPADPLHQRLSSGTLVGIGAGFSLGTDVRLMGIRDLLREIEELRERVGLLEQTTEIIDEPDMDEALETARSYFDSKPGHRIYPDELAAAIGTSVSQAIEICEALEKEGSIAAQ
jgi:hypothetical protein